MIFRFALSLTKQVQHLTFQKINPPFTGVFLVKDISLSVLEDIPNNKLNTY
jgi:hypothetical protein